MKETRLTLIIFSAITGFLLFCFFQLLAFKPGEDGKVYAMAFGEVVMLMMCSIFIALVIFMVITIFSAFMLRIELFPRLSRPDQYDALHPFGDNHPFFTPTKWDDESNLAAQIRENWDHDPMNPASAEYQSIYRRWWHQDD